MNSHKIRKRSTALIIICGLIILLQAGLFLGAGGVLNELDQAVVEIENLEQKNLLSSHPQNISANTKFYLDQYHNSSALKQHIKDYEKSLYYREISLYIVIALFILGIGMRIYFRKTREKK